VSCPTASNCVAVGVDGVILTTNGGSTWTARPSGTTELLYEVSCPGLTWMAPGGQDGYVLSVLPFTGGKGRAIMLPGAATNAADDTSYMLLTTAGGAPLGNSDYLCAVPGTSTLGVLAGSPNPANQSLSGLLRRMREAAGQLECEGGTRCPTYP
jgi:hypothetical protein